MSDEWITPPPPRCVAYQAARINSGYAWKRQCGKPQGHEGQHEREALMSEPEEPPIGSIIRDGTGLYWLRVAEDRWQSGGTTATWQRLQLSGPPSLRRWGGEIPTVCEATP